MADEKYPRQGDHMTNDETELRPSHSTCMECGAVVGTNSNCENCRRMATRNWPSRHLWGTDGTCLNCGKMEDRANEQCIPVANGDKGLAEIKTKCEQYWNEHRIGSVEVHAILEFIHTRTVDVIAKVERLERVRLQNENLIQHQSLKMDQFAAKVERLEADQFDCLHNKSHRLGIATGMQAAAKVAPREPAGMRSGDEGFWTGWLRGVREFRAAILAAAKQQTGEAGSLRSRLTYADGKYDGMEEAAKVERPRVPMLNDNAHYGDGWVDGIYAFREAICTAAKQLMGEAGSRECSLSTSGESRAPASPVTGSASPVPSKIVDVSGGDGVTERAAGLRAAAEEQT